MALFPSHDKEPKLLQFNILIICAQGYGTFAPRKVTPAAWKKMCYYTDRHNQLRNTHHLSALEEFIENKPQKNAFICFNYHLFLTN